MGEMAIRVEGLGKQYRIGPLQGYKTLRESLMQAFTLSYQRLQSLFNYSNGPAANDQSRFWALQDVSFEVRHGEVLGVIGRNGAGKSTLLKILSRITEPTEGYADISGRVGSLLEVGTGFHSELTGRENIYLNGAVLGMTRREIARNFDEIVAFAEVDAFLDTQVKHYSSGMYMRLAFAVAAHLHSEILLVDEVLAVGDAAFQKKCLGQMNRISQQGRTVIFVSHNLGAVNELCSSCVLLDDGKVLTSGRTEHVISAYLSQPGVRGGTVRFACRSSDACFESLVLENKGGEAATVFALHEPITVAMRVHVRKRIRGLQASIALFNFRGDRIFYHSTAYCDPPLLIEQPGIYDVIVELPAKLLLPGPYCLNIALHLPHIELFDFQEHVAPFKVEDTGSGRYEFPPHTCGCVFVELNWGVREVPLCL